MKKLVFLFIIFVLTACASTGGGPVVQDDQFSNTIKIDGVKEFHNPFGGPTYYWYLRSWIDKNTFAVNHQLYVYITYFGGWKFFNSAANDQAKSLRFVSIDQSVEDCGALMCSLDETFGASIDNADLRKFAQSGFQVKFSAHDGSSIIVTVSSQQIQQQLGAIELTVHPEKMAEFKAYSRTEAAADHHSETLPPAMPVAKVRLGIHGGAISPKAAADLGMDQPHGLVVVQIDEGLPADKAGLQINDIILEYNGVPLDHMVDLLKQVG